VKTFRPGFLSLARRSQQPIYPVGIAGANRAMPKGALWIRPVRIEVVYGTPFTVDEIARLQHEKDDSALAEMARLRVAECASKATHRLLS
jgi:1-acyl-sn-glycerol-3-phosphate acyltransferase